MPRRVVVLLVAALLVTGVFAPAVVAQDEPAILAPCVDGPVKTAEPGQPIHLFCGWSAQGGPGKLVTFLNSYSAELTVRDAQGHVVLTIGPDVFATLWGTPETFPADDDYVYCAGPTGRFVMWDYWLNEGLPAGTYTVDFVETFLHPVSDGLQTCWVREDGSRYLEPPSLYKGTFDHVRMLVVAPAP